MLPLFRRKSSEKNAAKRAAQRALAAAANGGSGSPASDADGASTAAAESDTLPGASSAAPASSSSAPVASICARRADCSCLKAAREWLTSPANALRFQIHMETDDGEELDVACPSLGSAAAPVTFTLSLAAPHGLSIEDESSVLDELEAASYDFLFGDAKPPTTDGEHDGCTLTQVLQFAHDYVQKLDDSWGGGKTKARRPSQAATPTAASAKVKSPTKDVAMEDDAGFDGVDEADDDAADGAAMDVEEEDDAGFSDAGEDDDGDGGWGDAIEEDVLDSGVDTKKATMDAKHGTQAGVHVFTNDETIALQAAMIPRVARALGVTPSASVCLLRLMKWNEDATIARFKSDRSKFVSEAHCAAVLSQYIQPPPNSLDAECGVCYSEVPGVDTFAMPCGHRFCVSCWQYYLTSELEGGAIGGGSSLGTKCMVRFTNTVGAGRIPSMVTIGAW
jgi:hypothetical protein